MNLLVSVATECYSVFPCTTTNATADECYAVSNCTQDLFETFAEVGQIAQTLTAVSLIHVLSHSLTLSLSHSLTLSLSLTHMYTLTLSLSQALTHPRTHLLSRLPLPPLFSKVEVECNRQNLTDRDAEDLDIFAERWKAAVRDDCDLRVSSYTHTHTHKHRHKHSPAHTQQPRCFIENSGAATLVMLVMKSTC